MSRPSLYAVVGQSEKRDVLEKGQLIQPCILEAMNYYQTKKALWLIWKVQQNLQVLNLNRRNADFSVPVYRYWDNI